jgi:hypothetical protein
MKQRIFIETKVVIYTKNDGCCCAVSTDKKPCPFFYIKAEEYRCHLFGKLKKTQDHGCYGGGHAVRHDNCAVSQKVRVKKRTAPPPKLRLVK